MPTTHQSTAHRRWIAIAAALVVGLLLPLLTAGPSTSATAAETVTVSGTIHHTLDGQVMDGFAEFYDSETAELVDAVAADGNGKYTIALPPGTYIVAFYNSSDGVHFTDFFPELYKEHPLFSGNADLVKVEEGKPLTINGNLRPMFFDMFEGTPFTDDIAFMGNTGITKGCNPDEGNTKYCPEGTVTREQMAAFLVRAFGYTAIDPKIEFDDIGGSVFEQDILRLATEGVTRGCNPPDNDKFCPRDPVTREQMAAFMVRAFNMKAIDKQVSFDDIDDSGFEQDILRLATAEVTKGCNPPDNTKFCPGDPVTRGEMAAFLHRGVQWLVDEHGSAAFTAPGDHRDTRSASRADLADR